MLSNCLMQIQDDQKSHLFTQHTEHSVHFHYEFLYWSSKDPKTLKRGKGYIHDWSCTLFYLPMCTTAWVERVCKRLTDWYTDHCGSEVWSEHLPKVGKFTQTYWKKPPKNPTSKSSKTNSFLSETSWFLRISNIISIFSYVTKNDLQNNMFMSCT